MEGRNAGLNNSEPVLRTLAERLLVPPEFNGEQEGAPPRLYPGRLPDGLPAELPIPDGATVVGGSKQNMGKGRWMNEVVLDLPLPAEAFREDYRRRLFAAGWSEDDESSPGQRGFVPPGLPGVFVRAAHRSPWLHRRLRGRISGLPRLFPDVLHLGEDGPRLVIAAANRQNAPTDVRLRVFTGRRGPRMRYDPIWDAIPSLISPPGARGRPDDAHTGILHPPRSARGLPGGGGGGWEPDGVYSHATLETDLDLHTLASHYTDQLAGAGWTLSDEGHSGPQAWSTWALTDAESRPWAATFSVLRLSGSSPRYLLQVHAGTAPDGR